MNDDPRTDLETPPPILGTWRRVYAVLAIALVVQIIVYTLLTRWLS